MLIQLGNQNRVAQPRRIYGVCCILLAAFLLLCLPAGETLGASGLQLYNYTTKKTSTYKDTQVKVTFSGKKISVDSTPGILENGIALVSYKDIFAKSEIKATCVYDKAQGTVTISKYGTTIVMKIGSLKGTVNGKAVTLPVAPVKINFKDANVTKILVPSRFVCQNLGLGYTWNSGKSTVEIVKETEKSESKVNSLSLSYDNGSKFSYTGTQGAVMIDGEYISLGNMPSIINNNTAMLRAKRVFADSPIGADYRYDEKSKTITLMANGNTLVMTIGSTAAYLNGTGIKLDRAPMIVCNHEVNTSYVMVPGNNTACSLGLNYSWDKTLLTSVITTNMSSAKPEAPGNSGTTPGGNDTAPGKDDTAPGSSGTSSGNNSNTPGNSGTTPGGNTTPGNSGETAPELGDSGMTATGVTLYEWKTEAADRSSGVHQLNEGMNSSSENGLVYLVARDYVNTKPNTETYMIVADSAFEEVTSDKNGLQLRITARNKRAMNYQYQIYGSSGFLVNTITTANQPELNRTDIDFLMMAENYNYELSLSDDKRIVFVTFYYNSITGITIGTNDLGDYMTITSVDPLSVILNEQGGILSLDFKYTVNEIGDLNIPMVEAKRLNMFYMMGFTEKTQMILGMDTGTSYKVSQEGNRYTLLFFDPQLQVPVEETPSESLPKPEEPKEITDKSKYEIIIPKAPGITAAMISDYDDYFNNRFSIKLPGDYTAYLDQHQISTKSSVIKNVSVFLNKDNETEIRITTSKLQGYEYVTDQNNIYVNIGNPRDIYPHIVVLDPGHGGPANGAVYFNTKEKDFNLKILYEVGAKYFNSDPSKLKVYYTRVTDVDMTLADRAAYASKMGADLFVSLHMNASTAAAAYGTEVYYSTNNNAPNSAGLTSKKMAEIFVNNLTEGLGTSNRGAKAEKYTVVHKNTVPAVLIELGFLSNKNDHAKLSDPVFQENAARIIYETLLQIFQQYPSGK